MKVQVIVKSLCKGESASTLETLSITLTPTDTILSVKNRISDVVPMPFPEQDIFVGGKAFSNEQRLSDSGIKEGDCLELICTATEKALVKQLSDLLGAKSVSTEELGLLYAHRHGVTIGEALKALGRLDEKLEDFVVTQKVFALKGGLVALVGVDKPSELSSIQEDKTSGEGKVEVSVAIAVQGAGQIIEDTVDMVLHNSDTVAEAKEHIAAMGQVPFPDQELSLGDKVLADAEKLSSYGISHGAQLALKARASEDALVKCLEDFVRARTVITPNELSLEYCNRYGVPVARALKVLGLPKDLRSFLEYHKRFFVKGNCVTLAGAPKLEVPPAQPPVRAIMENVMDRVVAATAFLNIHHMEQRSAPQGGDVTIFVNGLPQTGEGKWLPPLLRTLAASLAGVPAEDASTASCNVQVQDDIVEVLTEGFTVRVSISPSNVA